MAVLVPGDQVEALDEARKHSLSLVVVDDEVLAGKGKHPFDDHVIERDRLYERL